jgi:adenosylhomocysteine nucleosidase
MKIGIIVAMREEFLAVSACFGTSASEILGSFKVRRFSKVEAEFILIESGFGFNNAAMAAEVLIHDERPDLLISAGFCGAISEGLEVGDVVLAEQIVISDGKGVADVPILLSDIGAGLVTSQPGPDRQIVTGTFVSTSVITKKKLLATILAGCYRNPVVEMESGAIAIVAVENNIPMLAIRAVSDASTEELDFSIEEFCDADLRHVIPHKVMMTIIKKPRLIPQLIRLSRNSRKAAGSITSELTHLFSQF